MELHILTLFAVNMWPCSKIFINRVLAKVLCAISFPSLDCVSLEGKAYLSVYP